MFRITSELEKLDAVRRGGEPRLNHDPDALQKGLLGRAYFQRIP